MDRRLFITASAAALLAGTSARAERMLVNSPGDGFLNLRSGPGSGFNILYQMPHGSSVETLESAGGWVRVRHESGAVGWAFARYLASAGTSPFRYIYSAGDGYLNLRTGPGTKFNIIRRMYNGEEVRLLERRGSWVRVRHESGAVGWASEKFMRR
ncbi:SH3 domain-containing protein [Maritimibacter sp. UBA3975]|uniref:SH3 domain-containing protein n=1 Tax=Maritimibacter sp. UBA3975 TaxID=1946833 RepID=UPI000C0B50E3|nr:SH3 domain-containing protein [Maritimibacter sp. UBA3975]MAM61919.1 beta-N-acetylglucosaminidase [Maritimibacter sp.]|tara:strand:+ start:42727 stop:43191 length:465 start_codon:yes stop_codon:yes gene_type:complete